MKAFFGLMVLSLMMSSAFAETVIYEHDGRPYDGALEQVIFEKLEGDVYKVVARKTYMDLSIFKEVVSEDVVDYAIPCKFSENGEVTCFEDGRPYDGALKEIKATLNAEKTFDLNYHTEFYSRMGGGNHVKDESLGSNLSIKK